MNRTRANLTVLLLAVATALACSLPGLVTPAARLASSTPAAVATSPASPTAAPRATATPMALPTATLTALPTATLTVAPTQTPRPTLTPTPALRQLEIVEWTVWEDVPGYQNVEVLLHNPNEAPVSVNHTLVSAVNSAGDVVYTTEDVRYYFWADDGWGLILPGETVPATLHLYPKNANEKVPDWATFKVAADLQTATAPPYTRAVQATLGQFRSSLEFDLGASLDITNTSGKALKTILFRLVVRNKDGAYLGVDHYLSIVGKDDAGNEVNIEPGKSAHSVFIPELTRESPKSLHYEITILGLLAPD